MEPLSTALSSAVSTSYERWAHHEADAASPLYAGWARGIAADDALAALLAELPQRKRQPNLVFAAARTSGVPLAPWSAVRDAFASQWPRIRATVLSRVTQTNEARRLATLVPGLHDIRGPIALIEVGASAGLCLYPDKWRYRFGPGKYVGEANRPLLETDASPSVPLPAEVPQVAWRGGVDLNPLDPADPATKEWLEALIWPNTHGEPDGERVDVLRTGLAIARRDPAHLVKGDLLEEIEGLVTEAKRHARRVVVWHSAVLAYLDERDRTAFADFMRASGVRWISNEGKLIEVGPPAPWAEPSDFVLRIDGQPVARTNPHGRRIDWASDL